MVKQDEEEYAIWNNNKSLFIDLGPSSFVVRSSFHPEKAQAFCIKCMTMNKQILQYWSQNTVWYFAYIYKANLMDNFTY